MIRTIWVQSNLRQPNIIAGKTLNMAGRISCAQAYRRPMHRIWAIASVIWITSFVLVACNNNDVKTERAEPSREIELRASISQFPDSFLLEEKLIQYLRDNGNYEAAIKEAKIVLMHDPANARFQHIKATLHFENGDTLDAISTFEKAVAMNPLPEDIISLGSLYAQTQNAKALTIADTLLQAPATGTKKQALFIKGLYYSYSGDKTKAIALFDNCLEIDYRDMLAYREKSICLYDLKKYTDALHLLQKALAIQKTFDEAYYWMGRCYEKLNRRKEAIESYEQALQFDPGYVEAKEALERLK